MPTPRIPSRLKPVIQGYSIGAPDGVRMTDVAGGLPRVALEWDRGRQPFQATMIMSPEKFSVWSVFFYRVIKKGSIAFIVPLDDGFGMADHLCVMAPGSYSAARIQGATQWTVSFTLLAEVGAYLITDDDVDSLITLWESEGEELDALLARIAEFATSDLLVLA